MKLTRKQIDLIQLALAGGVVLISALVSAHPLGIVLGLWFGALWLVLAWRFGISTLLMSLLVMMALRGEAASGLPSTWFLSVNLGLSAVTLASWFRVRWAAPLTAGLWMAMMWGSPLLLLLTVAGFPRFRKMFGDHSRWFMLPGMVFFCGLCAWLFSQGSLSPMLERPFEAETYAQLQSVFLSLFSVESLWRIVPLVGIFEVAQKQPDDHRLTWRNLMLFAAVVSLVVVPPEPALQILYLVGVPLSSIMLSRWCLALPDLISRSLFCLGMSLLALPFLQGGFN